MGFFDIFKRKPGGTDFGNLLRGVASQATGGILGHGTMMISEKDADKRDLSDADYEYKYGYKKDGKTPAVMPYLQQAAGAVLYGAASGLDNFNQTGANASNAKDQGSTSANLKKGAVDSFLNANGKYILLVIAGVVAYILIRKK